MKKSFMLKAGLLLVQAVLISSFIQADSVKSQEFGEMSPIELAWEQEGDLDIEQVYTNCDRNNHKREINANLEALYAFNDPGEAGLTVVPTGADVPFNNGNSNFPPDPLSRGNGINQLNDTDFLIFENGNYLVTFYGYSRFSAFGSGVQLFVNNSGTGPVDVTNAGRKLLYFSQIIRIKDASKLSPAVLEVKAIPTTNSPGFIKFSNDLGGINLTLEIVKLSSR